MNHTLNIKMVNKHENKLDTKKDKEPVELDFGSTSLKLCDIYLDVYEGV